MSFPLPPTGSDDPPAFLTTLACQDWLANVPMANPGQAQVMLLRQLNLLQRFTLANSERLALLELLRDAVGDVQIDVAKKFAGKPLPLTPPEQAALDGTLALWQALLGGYLRLLEAAKSDSGLTKERARIAQRALAVLADLQVDLCRGEQLPNSDYWRTLYQVFALAEEMGVLVDNVADAHRHGSTQTSALGAFGESLLLYTASPFELPSRQLNWIARWAKRWGSKLGLLRAAPHDITERAMPICVDLAGDRPPGYQPHAGAGGRWLETTALRKSIRGRLTLLDQGEQPSRLHLGEDCTQPAAGQQLQRVYQRWCKGGAARRQERKSASGGCDFIVSLNAVHYYLSGRTPFRPPSTDDNMLRKEREELATFGQRSRHQDENYSDQQGFDIEQWAVIDDWQLLDQSANGLRLTRPLKGGVRVGSGQLVAIKLAGSSNYVIGGVRWALQDTLKTETEMPTLSIGIQLFPGQAQAVAVRATDVRDPYAQGLLLPAIAALKEPETLILPAGTFRIDRPVDVRIGDRTMACRLARIIDRANEFERCTFSPAK